MIRTRNVSFETGRFSPWVASGSVLVDCTVACAGRCSALLTSQGTGSIAQTTVGYPNRCYQLSLRAGACGGVLHGAITLRAEFLGSGRVLRRVSLTIPPNSLPDICSATPASCRSVIRSFGVSPPGTDSVRLSLAKLQAGGADLILDEVLLIEQTNTALCLP